METGLLISVLGAATAIVVSLIGAWLANRNSISLQTRKLKEQHYIFYIEALHNLAANNDDKSVTEYVFARDKLLLIANEDVVKKMLKFELEGVGKAPDLHDIHLTELIKTIRRDLKLKDKNFPSIAFKKSKM